LEVWFELLIRDKILLRDKSTKNRKILNKLLILESNKKKI